MKTATINVAAVVPILLDGMSIPIPCGVERHSAQPTVVAGWRVEVRCIDSAASGRVGDLHPNPSLTVLDNLRHAPKAGVLVRPDCARVAGQDVEFDGVEADVSETVADDESGGLGAEAASEPGRPPQRDAEVGSIQSRVE